MNSAAIEIRVLDETFESALAKLFHDLRMAGDDKYFHPHPLTNDEAKKRAQYSGKDLYYVMMEGKRVIGYAMLRGWDEGYEVPSLGIVLHPSERGMGLGELLMRFLHLTAKRRNCSKIRIKVYPENTTAVALYKKLGYSFCSEETEQIVGFVNL